MSKDLRALAHRHKKNDILAENGLVWPKEIKRQVSSSDLDLPLPS
jgi:hypothetical protein